ncbi:hypothetical protein RHGRI_026662 [Rhododendron griersonianum]|uniref:Uncharacterized protein n=1 Tax=Rhododendron griersonianum TaxID=479676 RepID=A0AAV6IZ74_9ERIC|nr:hypothetical protein RHGRI_026662 [Rhododendron griersonianum]
MSHSSNKVYAFGRSDVVGLLVPFSTVFGACDSVGSRRLGGAWRLSALASASCSVVRGCADLEWWIHGDEGFRSFLGSTIRLVHGGLGALQQRWLRPSVPDPHPCCCSASLLLVSSIGSLRQPPSLILVLVGRRSTCWCFSVSPNG